MHIDLKSALSLLPLPATASWPEGVWDKTVFEHGTTSVVVFAPRGRDYQTSHKQDELYIVIKGSGILTIEDTPYPFTEGDVLFVPAEKQHRLAEFSQDLVTWAIFWGPPGGEKKGPQKALGVVTTFYVVRESHVRRVASIRIGIACLGGPAGLPVPSARRYLTMTR